MDNQAKDGTQLFDQARRELVQGNLGMALARALDAADMDHAEASFLVALMYFTGTGIQRNTETASEYANKYLLLQPDGPKKSEARAIIDGTIGTANAKNMILGSEYAKPDTPASARLASNKWVMIAVVVVVLLVMFLVGYLVLQKNDKPVATGNASTAPALAASQAASEASAPAASESAAASQAPAATTKPQPKTDPNIRSQLKSGDVSITETKNGERVIRSGDLVIRMPD
jgi:hypothetical protein